MSYLEILARHFRLNKQRADNYAFLKAAMAACAIISAADGSACKKESRRVKELMRALKILNLYDVKLGVDLYSREVRPLLEDFEAALPKALDLVHIMNGDTEACRLIVEICRSISEADGIVYPSEEEALGKIAGLLDMPTDDIGRIELPSVHDP
ncbi:MAG: TerB family tellurite resistance protein [Magnetovibrionaceae bacterium]